MTSLYFHAVRATSFIWPDGFDYTNKIYVLYAIACVLGIVLLKKNKRKHTTKDRMKAKRVPQRTIIHMVHIILHDLSFLNRNVVPLCVAFLGFCIYSI